MDKTTMTVRLDRLQSAYFPEWRVKAAVKPKEIKSIGESD